MSRIDELVNKFNEELRKNRIKFIQDYETYYADYLKHIINLILQAKRNGSNYIFIEKEGNNTYLREIATIQYLKDSELEISEGKNFIIAYW